MPPSAPQPGPPRKRRREWLVAVGVLAAALALWFPGLLAGHQLGQSHVLWSSHPWLAERPAGLNAVPRSGELDAAVVFRPLLSEARRQLGEGHLPLWNPYSFAGMPLLGDWQSGWLFPLNWVGLVLGVEAGWGWIAVLKLLAGGLGAFALGRRWGFGTGGAVVAGLVFMLSAPNLVWLQWPVSTVFCLLPWLLLATDRVARRPDGRGVAGVGAVVGVSLLAGHPESALISSSAVAIYLAALLWRRRAGFGRAVAAWLGGHLLGVAVAGAVILPFMQAWAESVSRSDHGVLAQGNLPWWSAIVLALPNLFGDGKPDYYGPPLFYPTVAGYSGVAAGLLALVAAWRRRGRPETVALAAMAVVALCAQFGIPPVDWIVRGLPPWNVGNGSRTFHVVALIVAIGAGAGVAELARRPLRGRAAAAVGAAAGAVVFVWVAGLMAAGELPAPRAVEVRAVVRFGLALLAGAACLWLLGRARPLAAVAAVAAVVAIDASYLRGFNVVLPAREAYPPATEALRALDAATGPGEPVRVAGLWPGGAPPFALPPNTGALQRLESVQGYDFPPSSRFADFGREVLGQVGSTPELTWNVAPKTTPAALTGLRALGVRYFVTAPGAVPPAPGLGRAYDGRDAAVWEDPAALPRAFLIGRERRLGREAGLRALARGEVDPRREVVVEPGAPAAPAGGPRRAVAAPARRVAPDRLRISVPQGRGGWLVVGEGYWSFWRAEVDGRPAPLVPANHTTMAVPVAAGARTVEVFLDRRVTYAGFALSALGLLGVGLLGRPRRRREVGA